MISTEKVNAFAALLTLLASIAALVPLTGVFVQHEPRVLVYYEEWECKYVIPGPIRNYLGASARVSWGIKNASIPKALKDGAATTYEQLLNQLRLGSKESFRLADDVKSWVELFTEDTNSQPAFYYPNGLTVHVENRGDIAARDIVIDLPSAGWFEAWSQRASKACCAGASQHTTGQVTLRDIAPGDGILVTFLFDQKDAVTDGEPVRVSMSGRTIPITQQFIVRQRGAFVIQLTLARALITCASVLLIASIAFFVRWQKTRRLLVTEKII